MAGKRFSGHDIVICPNCRNNLRIEDSGAECVQCGDFYPISDKNNLDLRLRRGKKVEATFELGPHANRRRRPEFGVMKANPAPEVPYLTSDLPIHLSPAMASHIPRAPAAGSRCLDLGCGAGAYRGALEKAGYCWIGFDYSHPKAPLWADAHALPFPDNTFDFIISLAVLEHIEYPAIMLREINRVLKPGGVYLGSVTYLVPFHDAASYFNMTHYGVWSVLDNAGLEAEFVFADPDYLGIRAIAYSGLFNGLSRRWAYAAVEPALWLHRLYWRYKRRKQRGREQYSTDWQALLNTGAFTYKAVKPITQGHSV
jgi:SAM-dependent methyltransferase